MTRPLIALVLTGLALPALPSGDNESPPSRDVVSLRFAWPVPARARVNYRRTRVRTGRPRGTFMARYEVLAEPSAEGLRVTTRSTSWRGDLPFPPALTREAVRASEEVVQRIGGEGEFLGLEGAEALRPVLARVLDDAKIPPEQAERALALALAETRLEAEELWNLAVGFWTGADLRIAETYTMQSEGELPLLPGVRTPQAVEFSIRRRVPCAAAERAARCVEAVLRSVPDRAEVERAAPQLLARVLPPGVEPREDASKDLVAESELVLVTDPETLLPQRLAWTKAVRLAARENGPPDAEQVDRVEYDYRWLAPEPSPRNRAAKSTSASASGRKERRTAALPPRLIPHGAPAR